MTERTVLRETGIIGRAVKGALLFSFRSGVDPKDLVPIARRVAVNVAVTALLPPPLDTAATIYEVAQVASSVANRKSATEPIYQDHPSVDRNGYHGHMDTFETTYKGKDIFYLARDNELVAEIFPDGRPTRLLVKAK